MQFAICFLCILIFCLHFEFKVMVTLIEQFITKMGLHDEPIVTEKTTELLRLLELRSVNMTQKINEYGKIVLCADIAATILSIDFDQEQALKLSGLRKIHYANHKRLFEKLLGLNRIMDVNDICIQLGLNEILKKAEELLELYRCNMATDVVDIDLLHPQYAAMAVYYAGKIMKKKIPKSKIMSYSNLRPSQWQDLEKHWNKFLAKYYRSYMNVVELGVEETKWNLNAIKSKENDIKIADNIGIEDYELWKNRMLEWAEFNLKQQQNKE